MYIYIYIYIYIYVHTSWLKHCCELSHCDGAHTDPGRNRPPIGCIERGGTQPSEERDTTGQCWVADVVFKSGLHLVNDIQHLP
jgi:hypothetical protein